MVLATDVTGQRRLEQATHTWKQQHARQMGIMRRLVAGGGQVFASFLESAEERLTLSLCQAKEPLLSSDTLGEIFERVHTIRGEGAHLRAPPSWPRNARGSSDFCARCATRPITMVRRQKDGIVTRLERALGAVGAARELFIQHRRLASRCSTR